MKTSADSRDPGTRVALSVAEAAHRIGIGLSTVKALVARGEINSFRVGRRVLIPCGAIESFVDERLCELGNGAAR